MVEELKETMENVGEVVESTEVTEVINDNLEVIDDVKASITGKEVGLLGLAAVGVATVGFGIYKGGKWVFNKVKDKLPKKTVKEDDVIEDDFDDFEEVVEDGSSVEPEA